MFRFIPWMYTACHRDCMVENARWRILCIVRTTQNFRSANSSRYVHAPVTVSVNSSSQMSDNNYKILGSLAVRFVISSDTQIIKDGVIFQAKRLKIECHQHTQPMLLSTYFIYICLLNDNMFALATTDSISTLKYMCIYVCMLVCIHVHMKIFVSVDTHTLPICLPFYSV